eukprot:TRINITY_DN72050_c0_g1_i1.p1 TRINITY_DN72050_c0_g1~~TRINITY_DN72050_c0_g1_i1.p1  ORF type:complete len:245 (+),score=59.48 TRINITY_DN72050_c0_g1_i1:133-867(+)
MDAEDGRGCADHLQGIRQRRLAADRVAVTGDRRHSLRLYDEVVGELLSLGGADSEAALRVVDLRVEALQARLAAARVLSSLGDWAAVEAAASSALELAILDDSARSHLTELGLLATDGDGDAAEAGGPERGRVMHRDAVDGFLYRARARLRSGNLEGAFADANAATALAARIGDAAASDKVEAAEALRLEVQLRYSGAGAAKHAQAPRAPALAATTSAAAAADAAAGTPAQLSESRQIRLSELD